MGKFTSAPPPAPTGPIVTTGTAPTFEGGPGYLRDPLSELFVFAAVNLVGEDTFYEGAGDRDARFRQLVHQATAIDPDWVARFVPYLRLKMNMRSASIVVAAESAIARRRDPATRERATIPVRAMVAAALQRPDEPAEFCAYWRAATGQRAGALTLPGGVQRGVADAVTRLYTERAAIKYDGGDRRWRMADVIAVAKPTPVDENQAALFNYLADRRWNRDQLRDPVQIRMITVHRGIMNMPVDERRAHLLADPRWIKAGGFTWEQVAAMGPMDAAAWEALIPHMGLMALVRNLRNFDEAGVSDAAAEHVTGRLADPEQVLRSRMFPYRFWSAYQQLVTAGSLRWGYALEKALTAATGNIPALPGRTLVLVDTSASMRGSVSGRSTVRHIDVAALFGVALAHRCGAANVDLIGFADEVFRHAIPAGGSVLPAMDSFTRRIGEVGHGTRIIEALGRTYAGQDRVVILTDMQTFPRRSDYYGDHTATTVNAAVPAQVPIFGVNLAGYKTTAIDTGLPNRYEIAGFSDQMFTMIDMLGRGGNAGWPF